MSTNRYFYSQTPLTPTLYLTSYLASTAYCCARSQPRPERPKSLILIGPTRLGKTSWARSLGPHAYVATSWDLSSFNNYFSYVVFDDVQWKNLAHYAKAFFGCQRDFSVSDKYCKKKRISGGVPSIYCVNPEDVTHELREFFLSNWGQQNIEVISVSNKLY